MYPTFQKLFHHVDWTKWHFHLDEEEEEEEEAEEVGVPMQPTRPVGDPRGVLLTS